MWKRYGLLLGFIPFILANCGVKAPSCSDENVIETIKKISTEEYNKNGDVRSLMMISRIEYIISAIITTNKYSTGSTCRARIDLKIDYDENKYNELKSDTNLWGAALAFQLNGGKIQKSSTIVYSATINDNKKDVYVEVEGLPGF